MDLDLIESFYRRAGGEIDYSEASFGEYDSGLTYDTAMTRNGELNGPRRFISNFGDIVTRTYKDGEWHGLYIWVGYNYIEVFVYREGSMIFRLYFLYPSGEETSRGGSKKNSFTDVTPETFLK